MRDLIEDILQFWFVETKPEQQFQKNPDFDREIIKRFGDHFDPAVRGEYDEMTNSARGTLALIILLDQFSRNMYRDQAKAFSGDDKALSLAKQAVERGYDQQVTIAQRRFIYLPFEHAEDMAEQERSVALFAAMKDDDPLGYDYAIKHLDVIEEFGRFPHRNATLGRQNTPEEEAYLARPGAGF